LSTLFLLKKALIQPRNYVLFLSIICISGFRLFWLPGYSFSQKNWDDEIDWIRDSTSMSFLDYILYRDAPGYFVPTPRLIILLAENTFSVGSFSLLRILVLGIQLACFAAAASCVVKWGKDSKLWLFLFVALSLTYIEELNYVHNVGYLFIFPVFLLIFSRIVNDAPIKWHHVVLSVLLISKPFTAVVVLLLCLYFAYHYSKARHLLLVVASYSIFYLTTYILLPHRWDTPFNSDPLTILRLIVGVPWIVSSTLFPAFSIGVMGVIRVFEAPLVRDMVGLLAYLVFVFIIFKYRIGLINLYKELNDLSKALLLIVGVSYILVFSGSDSFWNKSFPLFKLDSPQFLWARWSAVIPFSAILFISSLNMFSVKKRTAVLFFVSFQWLLLTLLGHSWLSRYW